MKFLRRTAHVVSIVALAASAFAHNQITQQRSDGKKSDPHRYVASLLPPLGLEASGIEQGDEQKGNSTKKDTDTWAMVTAIATVIYMIFSGLQWSAISRQGTLTDASVKKAEQAVDAANRNATGAIGAAKAAERSAEIAAAALEHMKVADRAWVSLETLDILRPDPKGPTRVEAGFKNSGRSPARILNANITIRGSEMVTTPHGITWGSVGSLPALGKDGKPPYDPGLFEPPAILVAGEFSRMIYEVPINVDEHYNVLTLRAGDEDKNVWIYGFIEYNDGISKDVRSYGWARRYDGARSKMEPGKFRFAHVNTHGYNYAD